MRKPFQGFRVGIVGASSLLGKELTAVLKERGFPVARLVTIEDEEVEMPVVDLREGFDAAIPGEDLSEDDFDFVFVAARPQLPSAKPAHTGDEPPFFRSAQRLARATRCTVIDVGEGLAGEPGGVVRVPFLEPAPSAGRGAAREPAPAFYVAALPATIVLSSLLLRLTERFTLKTAVAQVFGPASELGPLAVEELQKQTSSLLSFQKIPQAVFGQQLAFNLLPRFGRGRPKGKTLAEIESSIQQQLKAYLGDRAPLPALRLLQSPVFHSLAFSLYVETDAPVPVKTLERALAGKHVRVGKISELPPSPVAASGSSDILVDAPTPDPGHPNGVWIWAVADNLRLAAVNAVEIAESKAARIRS